MQKFRIQVSYKRLNEFPGKYNIKMVVYDAKSSTAVTCRLDRLREELCERRVAEKRCEKLNETSDAL